MHQPIRDRLQPHVVLSMACACVLAPASCALQGCVSWNNGLDSTAQHELSADGVPVPPPADFALSVTVIGAPAAAADTTPNPAAAHHDAPSGWYLLDCDCSLRAGLGVRLPSAPPPGHVRTLAAADREAVWAMCIKAGAISSSDPGAVHLGSERAALATRVEPSIVVAWAAAGRARVSVFAPVHDEHAYKRVLELADELSRLAWQLPVKDRD